MLFIGGPEEFDGREREADHCAHSVWVTEWGTDKKGNKIIIKHTYYKAKIQVNNGRPWYFFHHSSMNAKEAIIRVLNGYAHFNRVNKSQERAIRELKSELKQYKDFDEMRGSLFDHIIEVDNG